MFTIADIRNIAIQIERNGEETYRNVSRMVADPVIAKTLVWMADEERRHAQWFEKIHSKKPVTEEQREMEIIGRTLLQEMIKGNTFLLDQKNLESAQTVRDILSSSKTFEQDTIVFYEFLLALIDDEGAIRQLRRIIEEERNHLRKLEDMARELQPPCK